MAYGERLADRIRALLDDEPGVTERKMFGGLAFMVNGNMACGPVKRTLMVRVGSHGHETALADGADEMTFTGRAMRGFVQVDVADLDDDATLAGWVDRGVRFAASLPPKAPR